MNDFAAQRSEVIAESGVRAMLADVDAELLGEDALIAEQVQLLSDDLRSLKTARASHEIARVRRAQGAYSDADAQEARDMHRLAEVAVVSACRRIVARADEL